MEDDRRVSLEGLLDSLLKAGVGHDDSPAKDLGSAEVMALISPDKLTGSMVRRSKRGANSANLDSTKKAMKRTATWNLDAEKGQSNVVSLPSRNAAKSNLSALGVCLGSSVELVEDSVGIIESLEETRVRTDVSKPSPVLGPEDSDNLSDFLSPLNRICGDLSDDFLDRETVLGGAFVDVPIKFVTKTSRKGFNLGKKSLAKKKIVFE